VTEWARLAEASGNVFATPEWVETWWRHLGRGRAETIEREWLVLPLELRRLGPVVVARLAGHGPGDELGPVCARADRARAAEELDGLRADVFLGEQLPGDVSWPGRVLRRGGSPVLRFDGRSWDELLASWSSSLRQKARRESRRLELRPRLADRATLDRDLDLLFRLHRARWRRETGFTRHEAFHRDFARVALERGWLRLWIVEAEGAPAAAWHGFRYAGAESYYQAGRDPAWDRYSIGFLVLLHSIRAALEDGAREYRFLRGGEEYKYRFATHDPGLVTVGLGLTPLGRAALAAGGLADRLRLAFRGRG
jgi:CelD/BcsL family acetyltransferase involved in cellulose biosynthesis